MLLCAPVHVTAEQLVRAAQAQALQQRLDQRGLDGAYVAEHLAWRRRSRARRALDYRTYYVGPELDRLSRLMLWD